MSASFQRLRSRIRTNLRDNYALLWSDAELDEFINEAQREYSIQARSFVGEFKVFAGEDGTFECPSDYIEPVRFLGVDGFSRPFVSWKRIEEDYGDFRSINGNDVRAIITDFDSFGTLRVFPTVPIGTELGRLFYTRVSTDGELETTNEDAIENHALHQALLYSEKPQYLLRYRQFLQAVNRESTDRRGLAANSNIREGCFF